jgi:hypothetical protein
MTSADARCQLVLYELAARFGCVPGQLALAVAWVRTGELARYAHAHGDQPFYPASVVKSVYAAYAASLVSLGGLALSEEDERAFHDMIQDSSNDATGHVVDLITDTTGGPELPPDYLTEWMNRRQTVNRWLAAEGIDGINACQKTWNEGPYGRERQGYGPNRVLANSMTTRAAAEIMVGIATGRFGNQEWLQELHRRDPKSQDLQVIGYGGEVVTGDIVDYLSKSGTAYQVRHDLLAVRRPGDVWHVIAAFTDGYREQPEVLQAVVRGGLEIADQITSGTG